MTKTTDERKQIAARILDCFPAANYALTGLLRLLEITETRRVATAAVECRAEPRLLVNPRFVEDKAGTPEKLLMLVMHELHHVLLGHTRLFRTVTPEDNLVLDAVINALLCRMFPGEEHTSFFTGIYSAAKFPECLLRPPDGWTPRSECAVPPALAPEEYRAVREVYRALYSKTGAGYLEIYDALRGLLREEEAAAVFLVGGHGRDPGLDPSTGGMLERRAPVIFDAVRSIVEKWPQPPDPIAGRSLSDLLQDSVLRQQRTPGNRAVLRRLLRQVGEAGSRNARSREMAGDSIPVLSPIPSLDRRTAVLTALGARPLLHPAAVPLKRLLPRGERVHVYVDVSGSIGDLKGALYGAVLDCIDRVHPRIHLFSTVVEDISVGELRQGVCRTTGGTDIECVAAHMRGARVRRAVLITDGYVGKPGGQNAETLARARIGVALTPGYSTRQDLDEVADRWAQLTSQT